MLASKMFTKGEKLHYFLITYCYWVRSLWIYLLKIRWNETVYTKKKDVFTNNVLCFLNFFWVDVKQNKENFIYSGSELGWKIFINHYMFFVYMRCMFKFVYRIYFNHNLWVFNTIHKTFAPLYQYLSHSGDNYKINNNNNILSSLKFLCVALLGYN